MINILLDALPIKVEVDGINYPIDSDYRIMILFEVAMQDPELTSQEAGSIALDLFYTKEIPRDITKAVDRLLWFYRGGKEQESGEETGEKEEERVYSFDEDAPQIFAAFMSQYGINLNRENLHWFEFIALFRGLKEEEQIVKIIGYRSAKLSSKMTKQEREHILVMKKQYKLKDNRSMEQKEAEFAEQLSGLF